MYSAEDFTGNWSDGDRGSSTEHRRHILDNGVIAKVLNIGDIQLSSDEFNALKKVINDTSVNKDNGCSEKVVHDADAVKNVLKSFSAAEKVYLPDHEASKIDKQVKVLLSEKFKKSVSFATHEKICASYQLLTANVYAEESGKWYDGKVVDGRKFKFVSKEVKDSIKANVVKYLKNNELKSKESEQNTAKAAENSSKQEYNQVKESNYEKYLAVVPYSRQGSSSRGGESSTIPIEAILESFEPPNIIIENTSEHNGVDINGIYTRRAYDSNGQMEFIYHSVENNMVTLHCSGNQYEIKHPSSATPIGYITENLEDGLSFTVTSDTSEQSRQIGGGTVYYSGKEFRRKSRQSWQDAVKADGKTQNHKITNAMFKDAYNSTSDQNIKDWLLSLASSVENIYLGTEEENDIDSAAERAIEKGTASKAQINHKFKQTNMFVKDFLSSYPDADADKTIATLLKSMIECRGRFGNTLPGDSNYKDVIAKIGLNALKDCPETTKIIKAARDVIKIPSNSTYAGIDTNNGTVYHFGPRGGLKYFNSNGNESYVSSSNRNVSSGVFAHGCVPAGTTIVGPRGGVQVMSKNGNWYYQKKR